MLFIDKNNTDALYKFIAPACRIHDRMPVIILQLEVNGTTTEAEVPEQAFRTYFQPISKVAYDELQRKKFARQLMGAI